MHKKLFIFIPAFLIAVSALCQVTAEGNKKISFSSINQLGFLTGGSGQSAAIQSINGVTLGKWFAGVGAGLDYYGTRGIPLFVDVRRDLLSSKNTPFIYVDGGVHLPWATKSQIENKNYTGDYKSAAYFDGGIGFKLPTKHNNAILISAGYSYKKVTEKAEMFTIWSYPTPGPFYEYYENYYRRIVVKVGFQF